MMKSTKLMFDFLKKLSKNNNREWFAENKKMYEDARESFSSLVALMLGKLLSLDPSLSGTEANDCIFRIYKDIRFSKDKTPYKTNFGAVLQAGGRKGNGAGFYIHIDPAGCFIGGGLWMPPAPLLKRIREEISYDPETFVKIMKDKNLRTYFDGLDDEPLTRVPRGFPADSPAAAYLKFRSYTLSHQFDPFAFADEQEFAAYAYKVFKSMKPFCDFIGKAAR